MKTSRGIILANPHPKPVNIFRPNVVLKKGRNKNSYVGSVTNGVEKIISKVQGEKNQSIFSPPEAFTSINTHTNGPKTMLPSKMLPVWESAR